MNKNFFRTLLVGSKAKFEDEHDDEDDLSAEALAKDNEESCSAPLKSPVHIDLNNVVLVLRP
jgi:hypothetical protein